MKSFKKIIVSLAALGLLVFAGCKRNGEIAEYDGGRYKGTMTIDATKDSSVTCSTTYRRYFKKISKGARVGHFETTVSVNPDKFKTTSKGNTLNSSVGIAFNVMQKKYTATNETTGDEIKINGDVLTDSEGNPIVLNTGSKICDFILISFNAANQFCIKHYEDVPDVVMTDAIDSDNAEFGHYYSFGKYEGTPLTLNYSDKENQNSGDDWFELPDAVTKDSDGWNQFTVKVEQKSTVRSSDNHIYKIYIGETLVANYVVKSDKETNTYIHKWTDYTDDKEVDYYCVTGAVYLFGNAYAGTRVEALFQSKRPAEDEENALFAEDF